jgi:cytochrome P450
MTANTLDKVSIDKVAKQAIMPADAQAPLPLPNPSLADLAHIPGEEGWPIVGNTFVQLKDPLAFSQRMVKTYGPVYRNRSFGSRQVALVGPEANELILFDRDKLFSSEQGWGVVLGQLFPRGLMLMDFDEHRLHRKIMSVAFKTGPMQNYLQALNEGIAGALNDWLAHSEAFAFYPAIKALTLKLAAPCFLGLPWGPQADQINQAFVDMVNAAISPVRRPLPGTAMQRGVRARAFMCEFFAREIPKRRAQIGQDMFSQLCHAQDDEGKSFSDQDIIDHMNFLMMAAHDTLTSSVSSLVWLLGRHSEWQERLREEARGIALVDGFLPYDQLGRLELMEMAFKEALRINPPVPALPRRALRDFTYKGYKIPAGTMCGVNPLYTHRDPALWPEPLRFDPLRFSEENSRGRHRYAWVPFGGGAHMCLGLHFAYMQAKVFFSQLLRRADIVLEPQAGAHWQMWPIPRPKDGLPLRLVARR